MSKETFLVIPPETVDDAEVKRMYQFARSCECWLCGYHMSIRKYADHMERHRTENWVPRDRAARKRAEVFAEWQQTDATPEDFLE